MDRGLERLKDRQTRVASIDNGRDRETRKMVQIHAQGYDDKRSLRCRDSSPKNEGLTEVQGRG